MFRGAALLNGGPFAIGTDIKQWNKAYEDNEEKDNNIKEALMLIIERTEVLAKEEGYEKIERLETLKNDPVYIWSSRNDEVYFPIL